MGGDRRGKLVSFSRSEVVVEMKFSYVCIHPMSAICVRGFPVIDLLMSLLEVDALD